MQRVMRSSASGSSAGAGMPLFATAQPGFAHRAFTACACAPSAAARAGVNAGIRPFFGSITIDVRNVGSKAEPESHQNALYALSTSPTSSVRLSRLLRSSVFFTNSLASSAVKNSLLPSSAGRSNGVMVLLVHTPCRSGWPSASRGIVHLAAGLAGVACWLDAVPAASVARAATAVPERIARSMEAPRERGRSTADVVIESMFGERNALELDQLCAVIEAAIERHAKGPCAR